jgi:hypothetical protein
MSGFRWTWRPAGGAAGAIERRIEAAHAAGLEAVAEAARGRAPHRSGEYAASIKASAEGLSGHVRSPLPQAGAVERGANVGPRRGPHMRGQPSIRPAALEQYRRGFARRM